MGRSSLKGLPTETLNHIGLYLNVYDHVLLGLTCRRFYSLVSASTVHDDKLIYFLRPSCKNQTLRTQLWLDRMDFMGRLESWLQSADHQARRNDKDNPDTKKLELCVGCAQYRYLDDDWVDGDAYGDMCCDGSDMWQVVRAYVIEGKFCSRCGPVWRDLTSGVLNGESYEDCFALGPECGYDKEFVHFIRGLWRKTPWYYQN